jgi:hypothetical protein
MSNPVPRSRSSIRAIRFTGNYELTQVLAFLLLVRAAAYARSRSRLVPGVLLAAASAAAFPGFRTLVRLSLLTLGFLFASHQPPAAG